MGGYLGLEGADLVLQVVNLLFSSRLPLKQGAEAAVVFLETLELAHLWLKLAFDVYQTSLGSLDSFLELRYLERGLDAVYRAQDLTRGETLALFEIE